jgi:hypothetical protein
MVLEHNLAKDAFLKAKKRFDYFIEEIQKLCIENAEKGFVFLTLNDKNFNKLGFTYHEKNNTILIKCLQDVGYEAKIINCEIEISWKHLFYQESEISDVPIIEKVSKISEISEKTFFKPVSKIDLESLKDISLISFIKIKMEKLSTETSKVDRNYEIIMNEFYEIYQIIMLMEEHFPEKNDPLFRTCILYDIYINKLYEYRDNEIVPFEYRHWLIDFVEVFKKTLENRTKKWSD